MATKPASKYKICKQCGNRNNPASGRCAWCGEHLSRPTDWFSIVAILVIVGVLVGLLVYSNLLKTPSPRGEIQSVAEDAGMPPGSVPDGESGADQEGASQE